METQPKGAGYDSHEVMDKLLDAKGKPMENLFSKENMIDTSLLVKKMADEYQDKINKLHSHINDLVYKLENSESKAEIISLENEIIALKRDWSRLYALLLPLKDHAYPQESDASLN